MNTISKFRKQMPLRIHLPNLMPMTNEETSAPEYLKGFQEGYMITMHLPQIAEWVAKIKNDDARYIGFRNGRLQYMTEQVNKLIALHDEWTWDDDE